MHDHNNKDGGHKGMMWMMAIRCALPIVVLLFGGSVLFSGGYVWFVLIGAVAVICIWMMFKGHGNGNTSVDEEKSKHDANN